MLQPSTRRPRPQRALSPAKRETFHDGPLTQMPFCSNGTLCKSDIGSSPSPPHGSSPYTCESCPVPRCIPSLLHNEPKPVPNASHRIQNGRPLSGDTWWDSSFGEKLCCSTKLVGSDRASEARSGSMEEWTRITVSKRVELFDWGCVCLGRLLMLQAAARFQPA